MGIALITWSCGHFVMKPAPFEKPAAELIASAWIDFWFLEATCDKDLANVPTERHVSSASHCPRCNDPDDLAVWYNRAQQAINILHSHYQGSKLLYLQLAARYHRLDFSQKARFANDPRCASAHEQFWISKTPREQDPFFAPMRNIFILCNDAISQLQVARMEEDIKQAFQAINKARAEIGKMIMPFEDLLVALELTSRASIKCRKPFRGGLYMLSPEVLISVPKAMEFVERMGDWEDEAREIFYRGLTWG